MKRSLVRICVFLILGAIVNVAVAWALSGARWQVYTRPLYREKEARSWWNSNAPQHFETTPNDFSCFLRPGFEYVAIGVIRNASLKQDAARLRFGWPRLSMEKSLWGELQPQTRWLRHTFVVREPREMHLPVRPIWPGFAINTVFYAVGLWGLFAAPFALRRRRRIRRGLCPKCAYDLRGTPEGVTACPECGAAVAKQKAETHKA